MLEVPPFLPDTAIPIIIGWPEASPLPPLASRNFSICLPESCRVLVRVLVGPCMDAAGDAALVLQLGRLVPDADCVSIICHASSFTLARKERFKQILPLTAKFREIRVIDGHDREYIVIEKFLGEFASEYYYLASPADVIPETITVFGEHNVRITPPRSPQNFLENYETLSTKFVEALKGGDQIQRIGITLDFLPSIAAVFQNLQHHSNLQELELIEPTTFGLESISRDAAMKLKCAFIDFLSNSNVIYLTIPLPLITPTVLRSLNTLPELRMLKICPVKGFCSVPYLCEIARRSAVHDFSFIELVNVVASMEDEITEESVALLRTTFPSHIVYQSTSS